MSIAEKLTIIAENEQKVFESGLEQGKEISYNIGYEEGHEVGYNSGYTEGNTNGKSDNLKKIWDGIQKNGNRTNYNYAFMNQSWDEETFRPNYDINCGYETRAMFQDCNFKGSLKKALDNAGVKLDTSKCVYFYVVYYNMPNLTEAPQLDLRKVTGTMTNILTECPKLKRIDGGIICSENTNFVSDTFRTKVTALEDCIFSGVIGKSIKLSTLTGLNHESIMSAINCLKDYSEDTGSTTHTITLGSTLQNKLTATEIAVATEKGWTVA